MRATEHEERMRLRPMLKTRGAGEVFVAMCKEKFALAMHKTRKANVRYKNYDSTEARSDPQASKNNR